MLQWLTFAAASLAAIGAVVGPVLSYRAAVRSAESRQRQELDRRQQEDVDHNIRFCLSGDPAIRRMGINQLAFLLDSHRLTAVQANAAAEAMRAALRHAGEQVAGHPSADTREDGSVRDDPALTEWDTGDDSDA